MTVRLKARIKINDMASTGADTRDVPIHRLGDDSKQKVDRVGRGERSWQGTDARWLAGDDKSPVLPLSFSFLFPPLLYSSTSHLPIRRTTAFTHTSHPHQTTRTTTTTTTMHFISIITACLAFVVTSQACEVVGSPCCTYRNGDCTDIPGDGTCSRYAWSDLVCLCAY
jgi:hypothetical protein